MQTASLLNTPITADNVIGRTFTTTFFNLEELGWEFNDYYEGVYRAANNGSFPDAEETSRIAEDSANVIVFIRVDDFGTTDWWPIGGDATPTGDDAQTILDLETLRAAHQLEEA